MASRVTRILGRRGAPHDMIDDALQTAAMRALKRSDGFDSLDGLVNWLVKVAWHEVQAEWRRQARLDPGEVPERPGSPDPAEVIEGRLALDAVADSLASLSDAERGAILGPEDRADDSIAITKMRRYRARRHLAAVVAATKTSTLQNESRGGRRPPTRA